MDHEDSYYGTGKDEAQEEGSYLQKVISSPGRTQLNIALFAAGIAVVLAIVCGYCAYNSDEKVQTNSKTNSILHH